MGELKRKQSAAQYSDLPDDTIGAELQYSDLPEDVVSMPAPNATGLANRELAESGITVNAPVNSNVQTADNMRVGAGKRFAIAAGSAGENTVNSLGNMMSQMSIIQGFPSVLPEPQGPIDMAKGISSMVTEPLKRGIVEGDVAGALGEGAVNWPQAGLAIDGGITGARKFGGALFDKTAAGRPFSPEMGTKMEGWANKVDQLPRPGAYTWLRHPAASIARTVAGPMVRKVGQVMSYDPALEGMLERGAPTPFGKGEPTPPDDRPLEPLYEQFPEPARPPRPEPAWKANPQETTVIPTEISTVDMAPTEPRMQAARQGKVGLKYKPEAAKPARPAPAWQTNPTETTVVPTEVTQAMEPTGLRKKVEGGVQAQPELEGNVTPPAAQVPRNYHQPSIEEPTVPRVRGVAEAQDDMAVAQTFRERLEQEGVRANEEALREQYARNKPDVGKGTQKTYAETSGVGGLKKKVKGKK